MEHHFHARVVARDLSLITANRCPWCLMEYHFVLARHVRLPRCRFRRREEPRPDHLVARGKPQRRAGRRLHGCRGGVSGGGARCSVQVSEAAEVHCVARCLINNAVVILGRPPSREGFISSSGYRSLSIFISLCEYHRDPITIRGKPDPKEAATKTQEHSLNERPSTLCGLVENIFLFVPLAFPVRTCKFVSQRARGRLESGAALDRLKG